MLIKMPIAVSVNTSDEPPNDTSGKGTPVIGSKPVTAPMLMTAWPTIHAVIAPAAIRPNLSGARRATRTPA